jgi:hypothetical protein
VHSLCAKRKLGTDGRVRISASCDRLRYRTYGNDQSVNSHVLGDAGWQNISLIEVREGQPNLKSTITCRYYLQTSLAIILNQGVWINFLAAT